jgi:hypothetical protein
MPIPGYGVSRKPLEQAGQASLPVRAPEEVFLVNLDHRQLALLGIQRVSLTGEFLLLRQQLPAGASHSSRDTTRGSSISASLTLIDATRCCRRSRVPRQARLREAGEPLEP